MITKEYLQQELAKRIDGYKRGVATTTDNIIAEIKSILVLVDALQDRVKDYDDALKRAKDFKNGTVQFALEPGESIVHYIFPELRESEDEEIRQQLLWLCGQWEHNPEGRTIPADIGNIKQIRRYLEKQKKSLHVQEICKENADSFTSEDERIRKEIIDFLETIPASELKRIPRPISEWFAWLEKQKESHIPWYDYQKSKEAGYTIVPNEEYEQLIKQKEQNPAWSEKNKKVYSRLLNHYESLTHCVTTADRHQEIREELNFLKSLHPQPKQEWSEENEDMLNSCISSIEEAKENRYAYRETDGDTSYDHEISWLKSLRPSWKPSEEQMEGLKFFLEFHRSQRNAGTVNWREYDAIESLYEQLKKL